MITQVKISHFKRFGAESCQQVEMARQPSLEQACVVEKLEALAGLVPPLSAGGED